MARTRTKAPRKGRTGSPAKPQQPPSVDSFREAKDVLADGGVTPLDVMIGTMRALWQEAHAGPEPGSTPPPPPPDAGNDGDGTGERPDPRLRDKALAIAEKVAPYIHPRARPAEPPAPATPPQALAIEIVFVESGGPEKGGPEKGGPEPPG